MARCEKESIRLGEWDSTLTIHKNSAASTQTHLPILTVLVPIETRPRRAGINVKVVTQALQNHLKRLGFLGLLANQVASLVPRNEFAALGILALQLGQFLDEFVIQTPVIMESRLICQSCLLRLNLKSSS